jgi:hypothetical protein
MAGTQLARVLEAMGGEEAKFNKLGVSVRDTAGNLRPFMDVLRDVGKATAGMNNADRMQAFMDIFDIRGARAAATLSQLGGEFDRILATIQGSSGAAAAKAETVLKSFGGQVQILAAKFADLKVALITSMGDAATNVVASLGNILSGITQFIQKNPQLVATVAAVAGGLLALGVATSAGGIALGVMAKGIGLLKAALTIIPALCTPAGIAIAGIGAAVVAAVAVARELSPAFRRETDAIWTAITNMDFASAWEIMNLNFSIALMEMAGSAETTLRSIGGFFQATGAFIGDKLVEGLDRFMGIFGADILTIQGGLEKLGLYFKAAFDWEWAANGLDAAMKEVDARMEKERGRSPTAGARADERAKERQAAADRRQSGMDQAGQGWDATADALREDLDRAHKKLKESTDKQEQTKAVETPAGRPDMGVMPVSAQADGTEAGKRDFGQSLGTFGSGEGLGVGPTLAPLEDAAKQTATNTARSADALDKIASAATGGNAATPASAVGNTAAAASLPQRAAAAQGGMQSAASGGGLGEAFTSAIAKVVDAVNAHAKISESHTPLLSKIAAGVEKGGLAFS